MTSQVQTGEDLVVCRGLQKQFPGFELNVSLRVPADTIVGLVGLNGSGKTTLFRLLTGLIRADGGSAQVLEAEIDGLPVSRKEEIGVVMADAGFPGMFTVKEVRKCLGAFYEAFDPGFFDELVKRFGIPAGKKLDSFSTGMKARMKLIAAISHHPRLLLLDEPTSGLDVSARNEILDILREYMETPGRAIMISSHIASDLEHLCDSFSLISRGQIVLEKDMDALRDEFGVLHIPASRVQDVNLEGVLCRRLEKDGSLSVLVSDRQYYADNYPWLVQERGSLDEALLMFQRPDGEFE
ncbi:ABC transporter ATP-binding protein [uncultured Faecalibaculum sp.]|uniref:ABC transporter ATP-binding protein n=2 Tax=uncultured Faecalibaculum sp. TaxID=1729681 RepID=UPI002611845D|nr:ABC transporter ATP-binding protein [uncultured Faecalibaculum sp.]